MTHNVIEIDHNIINKISVNDCKKSFIKFTSIPYSYGHVCVL